MGDFKVSNAYISVGTVAVLLKVASIIAISVTTYLTMSSITLLSAYFLSCDGST